MASSSKILGLLRTTLITLFPSIVSAPPHARLVFSQTFLADEQTRQDGGCAGHSSALCGESMKTSSCRPDRGEIGRASCRERVCQYVEISVVDVSLKKTANINRKV